MPPSTEHLLADLAAAARRATPAAEELRERLRACPETAHREHETAQAVEDRLGPPDARFAATGLVYRVGDGPGGVVARAELDALPLAAPDSPAGAERQAAHACGHDVHMAGLSALVEAARAVRPAVPLWAVFQPSEEAYPSGAQLLADAGTVAGARAVVACHVHPDLPWDVLAASPGAVNAACDNVEIRMVGRGGHAAYPHRVADPVLALASAVTTLHAALPRRVDPLHPTVVSIGVLRAGQGPSIVPEEAVAEGTVRTLADADRELLREALREIVDGVAHAHGCHAQVTITVGEPVLRNDERLVAASARLAPAVGLRGGPGFRSCGSDDVAFLGAGAPLAMAYLGLAGAPGFVARPLHHPELFPPREAVGRHALALAVLYAAAVEACGAHDHDPPEAP